MEPPDQPLEYYYQGAHGYVNDNAHESFSSLLEEPLPELTDVHADRGAGPFVDIHGSHLLPTPIIHEGFIPNDDYDEDDRNIDDDTTYQRFNIDETSTTAQRPFLETLDYSGSISRDPSESSTSRRSSDPEDQLAYLDRDSDHSNFSDSPGNDASEDDAEHYMLKDDVSDLRDQFRQKQSQAEGSTRGTGGRRRGRPPGRGRGRGRGRGKGEGQRGGRTKGMKLGPRKAAEPSPEIKALLAQANSAFISGDYDRASDIADRILEKNDEIYAAYALLSEINFNKGEKYKSLVFLTLAAHLRPKDPQLWAKCARLALEQAAEPGQDRSIYLNQAIYCYNQVIRVDNTNLEARMERAALYRELGQFGRSAGKYETILKALPHDMTILRHLAEVYIDKGDIAKAKQHYETSIDHYSAIGLSGDEGFTWSDLNIYVELFGYLEQYADGISRLKSLARWLLGRAEEKYWDDFRNDDREWDSDDSPRRVLVSQFVPKAHHRSTYGDSLPLELRVKLGIYRLRMGPEHRSEAENHFNWLHPEDDRPGARLYDYPDLFREAADALADAALYNEALKFYEPLQQVEAYPDLTYYFAMGKCYRALDLNTEAEECYQTIIENDPDNVESRVQLAKLYEKMGLADQAFVYANEAMQLGRRDMIEGQVGESLPSNSGLVPRPQQQERPSIKKRAPTQLKASGRQQRELLKESQAAYLYQKLKETEEAMRGGDEVATSEWMEVARSLLDDFRSQRALYPWIKLNKFVGLSKENRNTRAGKAVSEMEALADRIQSNIGTESAQPSVQTLPETFRDIRFDEWLDIFLEYALCLAKRGQFDEAYDFCTAAREANVFYHFPDALFIIHICWISCALIADDQETICTVGRWFMKEYQFVTDSYRLFAAVNRVCRNESGWYNSGPVQKFVLRQVKAMDYPLVDEVKRSKFFGEMGGLSSRDEDGNRIQAQDMDVGLLMLYGQILYAGTSYTHALNYFFRAYALDPDNPMINLSLALSYIHYALKRQSENRHYQIMQGLSFLFVYHDIRMKSTFMGEHQEAHFNVARAMHMLGLVHVATTYYEKCLQVSDEMIAQQVGTREGEGDLAREAALQLQSIWAMSGQWKKANEVTERYLAI